MNSLIEDLESQVTIECVIEQQHHRYVTISIVSEVQYNQICFYAPKRMNHYQLHMIEHCISHATHS